MPTICRYEGGCMTAANRIARLEKTLRNVIRAHRRTAGDSAWIASVALGLSSDDEERVSNEPIERPIE